MCAINSESLLLATNQVAGITSDFKIEMISDVIT